MGTQTRRTALKIMVAACCCGSTARAAEAARIDQITDVSASAATDMFRFEPDLVRLGVGDEIAFLNSRGEHTVHSVAALWPAGMEPVAISNKPEVRLTLSQEGIYAFRCRRHGQYGMVMLVVAGSGGDLEDARARVDTMKARSREKQAFLDLIDQLENG